MSATSLKAHVADGCGTAEDDFALLMGGQGISKGGRCELMHHGECAAVAIDAGQRRRQTVFAEVPVLGGVERRCFAGRAQVFVIPEAGQIEIAVVGGIVGGNKHTEVKPSTLAGCQRDTEPQVFTVGGGGGGDFEWQRIRGLQSVTLSRQLVGYSVIARRLQAQRKLYFCSGGSQRQRQQSCQKRKFSECFHCAMIFISCKISQFCGKLQHLLYEKNCSYAF